MTIEDFTSRVGPTVPIPDAPLDVFELFFSHDLQEMIVCESNRYARQVMGEERYRSWKKITVEELKAFFGFFILMGIDHLPSIVDYWSKDMLPLQRRSLTGTFGKSPGTCTLWTTKILLLVETPRMIGLARFVPCLTTSATSSPPCMNHPRTLPWTKP